MFPRQADDGRAVVHLVNVDYDQEKDRVSPKKNLRVQLPKAILQGVAGEACLIRPGAEPLPVAASEAGECISLEVPELDLWGAVKLA
ncbi:MAG: hypothetical protein JXR37_33565 [Kiritimatiellae bacterium]|nr:hypothetical protein [Kiritimatiellia bacterium]